MQNSEYWKKQDGFPGLGRKLKVLVVKANDGGCTWYRTIAPFQKLEELYPNVIEVRWNDNPLGWETSSVGTEGEMEDMQWADIVHTANIHAKGGNYTARICGKTKEFGKQMHFDTDDLLTELYDEHKLKEVYEKGGLSETTKFIYYHSDLVTVTQEKFANRISQFINQDNILAMVKNAIDYNLPCWNAPKTQTKFCKIGWAGGIHHIPDVKEFSSIPWLVNQKAGIENVRWDFYGRPPLDKNKSKQDQQKQFEQETWNYYEKVLTSGFKGKRNYGIYGALPTHQYGVFYANMDVAIAPLKMNVFNDSKSDIKVAEAGRYAVPLIASDVGCYSDTIKNGITGYLIPPDAPKSEWVRVLTKVIKDKKHREEMGQNLKKITDEMFDFNKVVHNRLTLYHALLAKKGIIKQ